MKARRRSTAISTALSLLAAVLVAVGGSVATAPAASAAADPLPARWKQIDSPGGGVTCAVSKTGQLWCWGKAEGPRGVAWNPATDPAAGTPIDPVRVGAATNWVKVQVSARHACAINSATEIWCWGDNSLGQLGQGDTVNQQSPVKVYLPPSGWTDVAVGTDMTCGLRAKTMYCWGDNRESELFISGQQAAGSILLPKADIVNLPGAIASISLGAHLCLMSDAGEAQCLRNNAYFAIPHPTNKTWKQIEIVNPSRTSTDSGWDTTPGAVANYHEWDLCGVRSDGVAQCFNFEDLTVPATLGTYTDWLSISYRADTPRWPVCGLHGDPASPTVSCFSGYGHEDQSRNVNYGPGFTGQCALFFANQSSGVLGTNGCQGWRLNYHDTSANFAVEPGYVWITAYPYCGYYGQNCVFGRQWASGVLPITQQLDFDPGTGSADPVTNLTGGFFIEQVARYPEYLRWGRMFALTQSGRLLGIGDKGRNERRDGRVDAYPMTFAPALASPPTLTSSNDAQVPVSGGKRVTLNGTYLIGVTALTVDGIAATGIQETDAGSTVSFVVPAHPAKTSVTVSLTTPGGTASLPNAFTYASPPSAPTVSGVTAGNQTIAVNWNQPSSAGDAAISGYTATASPSNQTCTWTSGPLTCTISGVTNGVAQTVTVVATSAVGSGAASSPSSSITPRTVPAAPSISAVTPGVSSIDVSWAAPANDGGATITQYVATALPGGAQCFGAGVDTGCTISSLTNGLTYTVTVAAVNTAGTGASSAASPNVTPRTTPGAPTNIVATPADRSLVVGWRAPVLTGGAAVTSYTVTASPGGSQCSIPAPGLACTIPNLTNGTDYTVTVVATNPAGAGATSSGVVGRPRTVPGAPVLLAVMPGNAQATLTWRGNADDGASPVTGFVGAINPGNKTCSVNSSTTTCTITGLTNGATYSATVTSTNAAGESAASLPGSVTPRTTPGAPILQSVTPSNGSALIQWQSLVQNGGAGIDYYTVTAASGGSPIAQCQAAGSDTQCTIDQLTNGTVYSFSVVATNAAGNGVASNTIDVAPRTTPGTPSVTSVSTGDSQATISWQLNANDGGASVTSVVVTAQPGGRTCSRVALANNCTVTGLTNGGTFTFSVVASNAAGQSAPAVSSATEIVVAPSTPVVSSVDASDAGVTVRWSAPVTDGGAPVTAYTATVSPGGATCSWSSGPLQCNIAGLNNGTAYSVRLLAHNRAGDSGLSGSVSFTPARQPDAPSSASARSGNGEVVVTWSAPAFNGGAPIADYLVRSLKVLPGGGRAAAPSCEWVSGPLTCTIDRLVNGTPYVVEVIAVNSEGQSVSTTSAAVKPLTVPTAVRALSARAASGGRLTLSFNVPAYGGGTSSLTYIAACTGGGRTLTTTGRRSPVLVTGGRAGVTYTCRVTSHNEAGNGPAAVTTVRGI